MDGNEVKVEWSPLFIRMMLSCYASPDPIGMMGDDFYTEIGKKLRAEMRAVGLLDDSLCVTEKGEQWVAMLCSTPLPEQVWVDPRES